MKTTLLTLLASTAHSASLTNLIRSDPRLSDFHYTLSQSNVDLTTMEGPFTIFAPVNGAFTDSPSMSPSKFQAVQSDASKLTNMMQYHIVPGQALKTDDLPEAVKTFVNGQTLQIKKDGDKVMVLDAACGEGHVLDTSVADNGILHIVDTAFVPQGTFCPDTVFATQGTKYNRFITAYGYDCRSTGTTNIAKQLATKPTALATSDATKAIFWTDDMDYPHGSATSWAESVGYDGTGLHHVIDNIVDPQGIATDDVHKKLYFATHSGHSILRTNYDGTGKETLVVKANNVSFQPSGVAVDAKTGYVFASIEQPNSTGYITKFNINNQFEEEIVALQVGKPYGLCVDDVAQHVYYIVGGHGGQIRCINYGSTPCKNEVLLDIVDYAYNCAVDNSMAKTGGPTNIVFSNADDIYFVSSEGGNYQKLNRTNVTEQLTVPMGVAFGCRN